MGESEIKDNDAYEEELLDYEEEDDKAPDSAGVKLNSESVKNFIRGYVGIHSSGFRDFLLKPELPRAIVDSGFEHPSEGLQKQGCVNLTNKIVSEISINHGGTLEILNRNHRFLNCSFSWCTTVKSSNSVNFRLPSVKQKLTVLEEVG